MLLLLLVLLVLIILLRLGGITALLLLRFSIGAVGGILLRVDIVLFLLGFKRVTLLPLFVLFYTVTTAAHQHPEGVVTEECLLSAATTNSRSSFDTAAAAISSRRVL